MVFRISHGTVVLLLGIATAASFLVSGGGWISGFLYALVLLLAERLTGLTAYGSRADSRLWFTGIFLALSPALLASQLSTAYLSGLLLAVGALYAAVKLMDKGGDSWMLLLLLSGPAALLFDIRLAGLLLPVALQLPLMNSGRKNLWHRVIAMLPAITFTAATVLSENLTELIASWNFASLTGVGRSTSVTADPSGLLYVIYPLAHPWFCVLLPLLLLLYRRTDLINPARRMLLGGALAYLVLIGGLPERAFYRLIPAYVILLTAVFPSWDRIYCYGLYFFKKTVWLAAGVLILTQVVMNYFKVAGQYQF